MSYPPDWGFRRRAVYKRDGHKCKICGTGNRELHAHHIVPKSKGGTHQSDNLLTVCKRCHKAIHGASVGTSWLVHLVLLVVTFGVGNVLVFLRNMRLRRKLKPYRKIVKRGERGFRDRLRGR